MQSIQSLDFITQLTTCTILRLVTDFNIFDISLKVEKTVTKKKLEEKKDKTRSSESAQ